MDWMKSSPRLLRSSRLLLQGGRPGLVSDQKHMLRVQRDDDAAAFSSDALAPITIPAAVVGTQPLPKCSRGLPNIGELPALKRYSSLPVLRTEKVLSRTHLPALTLRSWERRYGVPPCRPYEAGTALYSERDVAALLWLRSCIHSGLSVCQAILLLSQYEPDYVLFGSVDLSSLVLVPDSSVQDMHDDLLSAFTHMNQSQAEVLLNRAFQRYSYRVVFDQLLLPVLVRLSCFCIYGSLSATADLLSARIIRAQIVHLIDAGMAPGEALRYLSELDAEVQREAEALVAHEVEADADDMSSPGRVADGLVRALVDQDEVSALRILSAAFCRYSVEDVCVHVLQSVLFRIEGLVRAHSVPALISLQSTSLIRARLAHVFQSTAQELHAPVVLIGCLAREPREIETLMLALLCRRAGLRVYYLGQLFGGESLLQEVLVLRPAVVYLSGSIRGMLDTLAGYASLFRSGDSADPLFCFSGEIFEHEPACVQSVPGVFIGNDLKQAVKKIQELASVTCSL